MPNYAAVTIVGHLGRDPETKYSQAGTAITKFAIATSRKNGQGAETTTWWRCTCLGKRGENITQYVKKGDPILVQGEPSLQEYTAKDGTPKSSLEVLVNDFSFIKGRRDSASDYQPAPAQATNYGPPASTSSFDDDIPF
jgi:single-strand DNA-binding protein